MHKNPSFSTSPAVQAICHEYFSKLNLTLHYFGHGTLFPNGHHYCLNSDSSWANWHLIEQDLAPAGLVNFDEMQSTIKLPHLNADAELGWSDNAMRFAKERFGIENLMIIFRKYNDRLESFFFDLHEINAHEYYINRFDLFENFIFYFKDKAQNLLQQVAKEPLITPTKHLTNNKTLKLCSTNSIDLNTNLPNQYFLTHDKQIYKLSKREYQCLAQLAHGDKVKDIARKFAISPRTIDSHLANIKHKLQIHTLSEAINIYWQNRIGSIKV